MEVLYFDGCPSHAVLMPRLRRLVSDAGGDPTAIAQRRVQSSADAEDARFLGSPSVRVNGVDVEPQAATRLDFGMGCRLYEYDGGLFPTPSDASIRAALRSNS